MLFPARVSSVIAAALLAVGVVIAGQTDDKLAITGLPKPNDDVVRGTATSSDVVTIMVNLVAAGEGVPVNGVFAIALKSPLQGGELIEARQSRRKGLVESAPVTVPPAATPAPSTTPTTTDSVKLDQVSEADTAVNGTFLGTDVTGVRVEVLQGSRPLQSIDATVDTTKHRFSATVSPALAEDESIHAHALDKDGNELADDYASVTALGYDWGRVRLYFSLGAEFVRADGVAASSTTSTGNSTTPGSFESPNAFVGLNLDYNWWNSQHSPQCVVLSTAELADAALIGRLVARQKQIDADKQQAAGLTSVTFNAGRCDPKPRTMWLFNSYVEARLTDIPISQTSGTAAGSGSTTQTSTASPAQFQGGYFEGGIYFPMVPSWAQWVHDGKANGLFVAPMAKLGFQAGDVGSSSSTDPGRFDVFRFYGFGARVGHFTLFHQPQSEAPELLSWLDVTAGRWDNFRIYPSGTPNHMYERPLRFDAVGRLKIPFTPFYVGGEVNVGPGPDDLRVFVGTRIDIGKVLTSLIPALK